MAVKTVQYIFNGTTYTLTKNTSTGKYEATVTAPNKSSYSQTDHVLGGTVKATDEAGNTTTVDQTHATLGASLKIRVKEKVAPVISITAPSSGAYITNATPSIEFTVTDSDSGVASAKITLDGTEITSVNKTAVTGGYKYTCTPAAALKDGAHTISVPPTLSITAPTDRLITNKSTVTVTGKTDDVTSKPVTVTINSTAVTVSTDGTFSKDVTLKEGSNTITIIAKDKAGKTTTATRTVTLDTAAPVIKGIKITPNPVDCGKTFIISVEVTD